MADKTLYAFTIAGGRGERLRPITDSLPKPMVSINGRPLLSYQVNNFVKNGVTDVVFLCGYRGDKVQEYFGNGNSFGFRAHYSFEDKPLGRGGAVNKGFSLLPTNHSEPVIVANGDILTNQPLSSLLELHNAMNPMATVMLTPYPNSYGVVTSDQNYFVTSFSEKQPLPYWINAGIYIFAPEIRALLPLKGDHETTTFPELVKKKLFVSYKSHCFWRAVDNLKDVKEAEEAVTQGLL